MPIRPENRDAYPREWPQIRQWILARANHRCQQCRKPNGRRLAVLPEGRWRHPDTRVWHDALGAVVYPRTAEVDHYAKVITVVLTISHFDHDPRNNDPTNLRALCQRCHLTHDAAYHARTRQRTLARTRRTALEDAGQLGLSLDGGIR